MSPPIKNHRKNFDLTLDVHEDDFVSPPQASQRNWVLKGVLAEAADDLEHLDGLTKRFVKGSKRTFIERDADWETSEARYDESQLMIEDQQVMQAWERPYMKAMAEVVAAGHGHVLEVGFGMGISATYMQEIGVASYTVIECNEGVQREFEKWRAGYPGRDIRLVFGKWQDVVEGLGPFDGIFFDTYPLSEAEFAEYVLEDVTFGAHFFETAAKLLRKGGVFSYYSNEIDSMSRRTQRRLFQYFRSISMQVVEGLKPPPDCDYWWADAMVVVRAEK